MKETTIKNQIYTANPFSDCLSGILDGLCRVAVHAVLIDDDTKTGARAYKLIIILKRDALPERWGKFTARVFMIVFEAPTHKKELHLKISIHRLNYYTFVI